jgi:nitroimidazol reductase NimA-like FMN-containing flavoprotein (pyridoxamine 5'-phosphate oxidase superfamily)
MVKEALSKVARLLKEPHIRGAESMRREDREIVDKSELENIVRDGDICRIAINTGGAPYIVPLNYGYSWGGELELYFHCAAEGRKLDLLEADNRVGFEIDTGRELVKGENACSWGMKYRSVIGTGVIDEVIEPGKKKDYLDRIMWHYGFVEAVRYEVAELEKIKILKLEVIEVSGKAKK